METSDKGSETIKQRTRSVLWSKPRIVLYLVGFLSLVYLTFVTVSFVHEARVAMIFASDSTDSPQRRIVNKSVFAPPADGRLKLSQISMLAHVIEASDSAVVFFGEGARTNRIVELLNEYTVSLSEYRWIRSRASEAFASSDTLGRVAFSEFDPIVRNSMIRNRRFLTDSLDRELL